MDDLTLKKMQKGEALEGLRTHTGWNALVEIIQDIYNDALFSLISKEDVDARARLKACQDILDKVGGDIDLAQQLRDDFTKQLNK